MTEALVLRDQAKYQLAQIKDIETGIEYLNKVKAIEVWAKAEKKDAELQNTIAEQKIRTQSILGGLLDDENVSANAGRKKLVPDSDQLNKVTLSSLGISKNESANFQKIAKFAKNHPNKFEEEIRSAQHETTKRVELTTSRILKVAKQIEAEKKRRSYEERVASEARAKNFIDITNTDKKFRVIYADPAWSYNDKQDTTQLGGAAKHYDTMSTNAICELPIPSDDDAVLFLWVTSPLLEDGLRVVKEWGFKYKTSFVWDKVKHNMGHYNSVRHEFLLVATKGSCTPDNNKLYDSVQSIERNDNHSEKPIQFLDIIDDLYWEGDKIELFCRAIKKDGWYGWGNEL